MLEEGFRIGQEKEKVAALDAGADDYLTKPFGIEELLAKASAKVYVHKAEREFLRGFGSDLVKVDGGDALHVGRIPLTFIHTPGANLK